MGSAKLTLLTETLNKLHSLKTEFECYTDTFKTKLFAYAVFQIFSYFIIAPDQSCFKNS
jgi:hypothetical protein